MPLTIVNNATSFRRGESSADLGHLGTRDRDNPANRFDFPGKANALLKAATQLRRHVQGDLKLEPIAMRGSSRFAEEGDLTKVHPASYLRELRERSELSLAEVQAGRDPYLQFGKEADVTPGTYRAARHSVGTAFDAIDVALQTEKATAFALVWPPGHHAEPEQAMGFCYLSTAALAALYARDHAIQLRPGHRNRVVLIDIDHHRGNGSAAALAGKDDVLFVDMFYRSPYNIQKGGYEDDAREYPYTHDDASLKIEKHEPSKPLQAPNVLPIAFEGVQDHKTILNAFIFHALPAIRSFKPDVVLWSLGLDSAKGDPLGGLGLQPSSFYTLIKGMRLAFPEARHCGVLEGGYEQSLSARCFKPALMALHDHPEHARSRTFLEYREAFLAPSEKSESIHPNLKVVG